MSRNTIKGRSNRAASRYGKTLTQKNQTPTKPKASIKPKGNPLKGVYGFKGSIKY